MIQQPLSYGCLRCRGPLPEQGDGLQLRCPCCGTSYPVLDGQVPILLSNPAEYLRLSLHENEKLIKGLEGNLQAIAQTLMQGTSKRPEALRRLRQAYSTNIALRRRITQSLIALGAATPASAAGDANDPRRPASEKSFPGLSNPRTGYVTDLLEYLRQDWGQLPDCREDVATIERTVADSILSHARGRSAALVLGAGTGRFAWALRDHFSQIEALDLSAAMALSYSYLTRDELRFYELNERIAYTLDGLAREIVATIPKDDPGAQKGALRYCVADALHAPFPSRSIPVIVSVFFSDVVPMPQLLREVDRLLAPGGIFVHFGPLGYHFYNYEEMRTADEVRDLFASSGVPIVSESWVPVWLHRSEARMSNSQIRAWSFVARRSDDAA